MFIKKTNVYYLLLLLLVSSSLHRCKPSKVKQAEDPFKTESIIKLADSLRVSEPDSATALYNFAIQNLKLEKQDESIKQLLASAYIGIAFLQSEEGKLELAWKNDSLAKKTLAGLDSKKMMSQIENIRGLIFYREGKYDEASAKYEEAISLAKEVGDYEVQSKILVNLASINFIQGKTEKALKLLSQSLQRAKQSNNGRLIAGSYLNSAIVLRNLGNRDSSLVLSVAANKMFEKEGDKNGQVICYLNLGTIYFYDSDYELAIDNYEKSKVLALEMGDHINASNAFQNLGEVYLFKGDYKAANDNYYESLRLKEDLNDDRGILMTLQSLGNLHYLYEDYPKSIDFFKRALGMSEQLNDSLKRGEAYAGLANVYSELNQTDSARVYYYKALDYYNEERNLESISNAYSNLGDNYADAKQYDLAEKYLQKALDLKEQLSLDEDAANVRLLLAEMYFHMGEDYGSSYYRKAEKAALEGYRVSEQVGVKHQVLNACEVLKNIYRELGETEKALDYFEQYKVLRDTIFNEEKTEALASAESKWNVERKQREIDNLEKIRLLDQEVIKRKEDENRLQKIVIWAIVAIFFSSLVTIFVIALYIRKKREALYQRQVINNSVLRMQNIRNSISPHFVFNTLNVIWDNIEDRDSAQRQFENLTLLIRQSLVNSEKIAISLKEEIQFVKSFVELQKCKLNGKLTVKWEVDSGLEDILVPGMILQIPVENAIKHGLEPKSDNCLLKIAIKENHHFIEICVTDNGLGRKYSHRFSNGTGTGLKVMTNTIHILNQVNDRKMSYEISDCENSDNTGTEVLIKIPYNYNYELN